MNLIRHPIVFLHLPRTGGGPVHAALARAVGAPRVAPPPEGDDPFPPGHALYSGPMDWTGLDALPPGRFAFTVLRDPWERLASLYFHFRRQAEGCTEQALQQPGNLHLYRALHWTADDCFFAGEPEWQARIRDACDNVYCSYFGTRRPAGAAEFRALPRAEALARARRGLAELDGVFHAAHLRILEAALQDRYGFTLHLAGHPAQAAAPDLLWPRLLEAFATDAARRRIEAFAERDAELLARRHGFH